MALSGLGAASPLTSHRFGEGESVIEAIADAFTEIGIDPYQRERTIEDWTKSCQLSDIEWDSAERYRVATIIWDHPTVITNDEIKIYAEP